MVQTFRNIFQGFSEPVQLALFDLQRQISFSKDLPEPCKRFMAKRMLHVEYISQVLVIVQALHQIASNAQVAFLFHGTFSAKLAKGSSNCLLYDAKTLVQAEFQTMSVDLQLPAQLQLLEELENGALVQQHLER